MAKKKSNTKRKEQILEFIYDCIITKGMTTNNTKKLFTETFNLDETSFYNYYPLYKNMVKELYKEKLEIIVEENLDRLNDLYQKAIEKKDIRNAREIIKEINNLAGLNKLIVEGEIKHNIEIIKLVEIKKDDE